MGLFRIKDASSDVMGLTEGEEEKLIGDQYQMKLAVGDFGTCCSKWDREYSYAFSLAGTYYKDTKAANQAAQDLPLITTNSKRAVGDILYQLRNKLDNLDKFFPSQSVTEGDLILMNTMQANAAWSTGLKRRAWIAAEGVCREELRKKLTESKKRMNTLLASWEEVEKFKYSILKPTKLGAFSLAQMAETGAGGGGTLGQMRGLLAEC